MLHHPLILLLLLYIISILQPLLVLHHVFLLQILAQVFLLECIIKYRIRPISDVLVILVITTGFISVLYHCYVVLSQAMLGDLSVTFLNWDDTRLQELVDVIEDEVVFENCCEHFTCVLLNVFSEALAGRWGSGFVHKQLMIEKDVIDVFLLVAIIFNRKLINDHMDIK